MVEIASVFEDFEIEAATIAPDNCRKIHVPILLRCDSIVAASGINLGATGTRVAEAQDSPFRSRFRAHSDRVDSKIHLYIIVQYPSGSMSVVDVAGVDARLDVIAAGSLWLIQLSMKFDLLAGAGCHAHGFAWA